jgi:hypothetical protein
MSQTQTYRSDFGVSNTDLGDNIGFTTDFPLLTQREIDTAESLVSAGKIRDGLGPLTKLLLDLGTKERGFRGVIPVPYGDKNRYGQQLYRKTAFAWVIEAKGPTHRETRKFLSTKEFVSWLNIRPQPGSVQSPIGLYQPGFRSQLTLAAGLPTAPLGPLPRISVIPPSPAYPGLERAAPLPSTRGEAHGAPPSYVSQYGDTQRRYATDRLAQLEADFRSVPRINGGVEFDETEYFIRLDALNAERRSQGLPEATGGVTPSTYIR